MSSESVLNEKEAAMEFAEGERRYKEVEDWRGQSTSEAAAQAVAREAQTRLTRCKDACAALGLLASNEALQELPTQLLSFLLCDFYLARLQLLLVAPQQQQQVALLKEGEKATATATATVMAPMDPEFRLQQLLAASGLLFGFMERLRRLEALDADTLKGLENSTAAFSRVQEGTEGESQMESKSIAETNALKVKKMASPVQDPAVLRTMKIERFKATRNAEKILSEVQAKINRAQDVDDSTSADGLVREARLIQLQNTARKALDELDAIAQELEIVYHMKKLKSQEDKRRQVSASSTTSSAGVASSSLTQQQKKQQQQQKGPGISVTRVGPNHQVQREVFKAGVFKPSHRLPTMTIEEFGELEMKKAAAAAASSSSKPATQPPMKQETLEENGLEDVQELVDKATLRDRAWDDWKDDHTKGAGVTKRF